MTSLELPDWMAMVLMVVVPPPSPVLVIICNIVQYRLEADCEMKTMC